MARRVDIARANEPTRGRTCEEGNTGDQFPTLADLVERIDVSLGRADFRGAIFAVRTNAGGTMVFTGGDLRGLRNRIDDAIRDSTP